MTNLQKGLILLFLLGAAFGLGRYTLPEKVIHEVEEKIVEVTKEVVKEVGKVQTHIIETTYPDGRTVKETFILDEHTVVIEKDKFNEIIKKEREVTENSKPQWAVAGSYGTNIDDRKQDYGLQVERRMLGNIWAGAYAKQDKDVGILVRMEF